MSSSFRIRRPITAVSPSTSLSTISESPAEPRRIGAVSSPSWVVVGCLLFLFIYRYGEAALSSFNQRLNAEEILSNTFVDQAKVLSTNSVPTTSPRDDIPIILQTNDEARAVPKIVPRSDIQSAAHQESDSPSSIKVAYVISITSCPSDDKVTAIVDGPAILAHSIRSLPTVYPNYDLLAVVLPNATICTSHLPLLGYKIIVRELGFKVSEINNFRFYQRYIHYQGCCGPLEFLKLEAYSLVDYNVVIHFDTDLLILKPMDGIISALVSNNVSNLITMNSSPPNNIEFIYTRDYVQMSTQSNETSKLAVQGGFFALLPSMRMYKRLLDIVRGGDFDMSRGGWGSKHYNGFYGAPQIQGLLSFFYGEHQRNVALELNPCIYNAMISFSPLTENGGKKFCRYGIDIPPENCTLDCRYLELKDLHSIHYTSCYKPWQCPKHKRFVQLCLDAHREWFVARLDLEKSWNQSTTFPGEGVNFNKTLGYCQTYKPSGYVPLVLPSE